MLSNKQLKSINIDFKDKVDLKEDNMSALKQLRTDTGTMFKKNN
jgi:hypothetical protein